MATSFRYFKEEIKEYLCRNFDKDAKVLDVGAGSGAYYDLLHDYFNNIDGVEIFRPNIENYDLENKYRYIYNKDIKDFEYEYYDIIIFGDILEHLEIEEAQKVLKYALKRCKEVIVAVPYCYKQGIEYDNVYEIHKQDDLTPVNVLERYPELELLYRNSWYGYYIRRKEENHVSDNNKD